MYAAERRRQIMEMLSEEASVSVDALAINFDVSKTTIRRDLNELEKAGLLKRTYGGAVKPFPRSDEAPFSERMVSCPEEKNRIGQAAAEIVEPGETIFVDGGTTTECMTSHLINKHRLTVVTFGLNIITRLAGHDHITVIVIGGTLHHRSLTLGGVLGNDFIETHSMRFDKAFIAAGGVSAQYGITNASFEEIPMKRKAIAASREVILVADSTKVGAYTAGMIAPVTHIHRLITDRAAPESEVEALRRLGVVVDLV